jgi:hypothetical protein
MPRRLPLLATLALWAAGCGSGQFAPVSGRVTLDDKPLPNAAITFQPVAPKGESTPGPGSGGFTDADGRYTLKVIGPESRGAVVGKHKVRITPRQKGKPLPAKYGGKDTILEFDVPAGGTDAADFQLKSK